MGYGLEDIRPRYNSRASANLPQNHTTETTSSPLPPNSALNLGAHSNTAPPHQLNPEIIPQPQQHLLTSHHHQVANITYTHTHQPNHKPRLGQNQPKPKPKNWASLLQSQSPSMDMKLEYFPDLQRGKEALVEIDLELTDVGKWNKYLVGHFLDGQMA